MERETGVEPATSSLGSWHSTTELLPLRAGPSASIYQSTIVPGMTPARSKPVRTQPGVVSRIEAFNAGRDPERLAIKYALMRKDAFVFLRGAAHLFYEDLDPDS